VSSRYFERLIPALVEHGRVIALDLPGFGRAPRPRVPLSVEDFAEIVATTLDELGVDGCVVVGHSMGSQVATRLAVTRPELVASLALLGPVVDPADRNAAKSTILLARDTFGESPRGNWLVFTDYVKCGIPWYLSVLPSMLAYRIEDDLPLISVPITLIRGERDPIARAGWLHELSARAPQARAVQVPHARHLVMHAQPAATALEVSRIAP
jgi:pimeloyl-ACP methyl ester carboxylesterase